METKKMEGFCNYGSLEEAREECQCDCEETKTNSSTFYTCAHGNCQGYHCSLCGKFEIVRSAELL